MEIINSNRWTERALIKMPNEIKSSEDLKELKYWNSHHTKAQYSLIWGTTSPVVLKWKS